MTTPFSLTNLTTGDLAYISCDATNYTGNVNLEQTINVATSKILPSPTTQDSNSGAIILYSTTSTWCNFTNSSTTNNLNSYPYLFVRPNAKIAKRLETYLQSASDPQSTQASISMNMSSMGNGSASSSFESDDSDLGPTPTTTVAMIILYSVTGIITLCFIVVIITGAIRAHRHPDRYGLLNLPGGAHQRRARGIARAMLDTIPIVKFGEKEPMKVPQDVEHGVELSEGPDSVAQARGAIGAMESANGQENSEAQRSEEEQSSQAAEAPVSPQNAAEEGLACSVCTEDFVKGQDTRVLPCNHKFHPECIDPWLLNVSGTCPLWYVYYLVRRLLKLTTPAASTSATLSPEQPTPVKTPTNTFTNKRARSARLAFSSPRPLYQHTDHSASQSSSTGIACATPHLSNALRR